MTVQDFVADNNRKTIGDGQCGALVDLYLVQVFANHTSYATALQYWQKGIPGFGVVSSPQAGDIACYNAHPGFPDGHIAIYNGSGQVFEQNADPDGSPAHLYNRATTYLLGYLRQEGEDMPNDGDVINVYQLLNGRPATAAEQAVYSSKPWNAPDGLFYGKIEVDVKNLQAAQNGSYAPYNGAELFTKS